MAACLIPLKQLHGSVVDFSQSSLDFLAPRFLGIFIHLCVQTFHKWADQRGAGLSG
jgi:hypothetical protein